MSRDDRSALSTERQPDWKAFRDRWIARKNGVLTQVNDLWLKKLAPKEAKREVGQRVNEAKDRSRRVEAELSRDWISELPDAIAVSSKLERLQC